MIRLLVIALVACKTPSITAPDAGSPDASSSVGRTDHSSSIAVSADGAQIYVVNPDADSVSILDVASHTLVAEVLLAGAHPASTGDYVPAVQPRALAVAGGTLWVTGQRSGKLYAIDLATRSVRSVAVGSEPVGVAVGADGTVFVACNQDATIVAVSPDLAITARTPVPPQPWSLGWAGDTLFVTHFLAGQVTSFGPGMIVEPLEIPDVAPRGDHRLAHGLVRGLYDVASRPGSTDVWVAHLLLATDTAQPELDFESTVFPALSILQRSTLSIDVADLPGTDGAIADIVSGPHAIAFTPDGAYALVVDSNSEDVLAIDAARQVEATLLRPLPGHMPEGIAVSPDGLHAYVDERNTNDVAVIDIDRSHGIELSVAGTIARLASDPMPAQLRLGQHLFYSANSDEAPITKNHWVACASCHLEGRTDAVTWRFEQGPRDTPTNAGGMLGTGFLFRDAARTAVGDYWRTINVEQGGTFDPVDHADLLSAITAYVDHGIPLPIPPTTDPALVAAGKAIFERADVGCASCHAGRRFTDSAANNPTLDLSGPVMLHDVGTCVTTGDFPDQPSQDVAGHPRAACLFDTPSLSGVASSPPYLHDGSAVTLRDVLDQTRGKMGDITMLSPAELDALVEYLRSL